MNVKSINGMRGCHITVTKNNRFLFVAGYHDGKVTVMRINSDGSLDVITDELFHKGIGSVAERNFRPHISSTTLTPDEKLLCVCDLGIDQIKLYEFDDVSGKLKLYDIIRTQLESAPRQIIFSNDGRFAYVLCELKNYIDVYECQRDEDGKLVFEFIQNIFTLRKANRINSAGTDIILTEDGSHLMVSNAGDNSVTIYNVDRETGMLTAVSSLSISGDYPKYIRLFPDEKHLMSMNHDGNTITLFSVHWDRGLLVMSGKDVHISKPNNMVIKKLED
jgi:6-phosphogluconolactonase